MNQSPLVLLLLDISDMLVVQSLAAVCSGVRPCALKHTHGLTCDYAQTNICSWTASKMRVEIVSLSSLVCKTR